jgi:polyisoprenoid-binding protein YceI
MLKKLTLALSFLALSAPVFAQKYMTRTGKITFNATAPKSPEKIEAVNNEVAAILNTTTGDFVFQSQIKSFKFERSLMQDHFNENYMQSDKFPKSEFKGKITNVSDVNFSKDGTYNTTVTGQLSMHGVTKDVSVPGTITVKGKEAVAKAKFNVKLADYSIEVPSIVADKLSKEAIINIDAQLIQK